MAEGNLVAIAGVIVAALLALFGVLIGQLYARIGRLEGRIDREVDYSKRLWSFTRHLLDLYYRWRGPGAPDPGPIPDRDDDE
jgi:hypothetical protein